ncbi:hypothetical protein TIFTF001_024228 [Ficus carica]|uniref:Pectinesterase inhibitor domain-containing protein n=1 Tax=Ficus carica TaxID=3494 RepID=A0AA88AL07_FICCA|nr:hypothetical protein TIFTF001_024228 [Ficus carica]
MDENKFIEEMCMRTPNHDLCTSILRLDPRSKDADGLGLTRIVVGVVEAKAEETLNHINDLIKGSEEQKQALTSCADYYNKIIYNDVPKAIQGLNTVAYWLTGGNLLEYSSTNDELLGKRKHSVK